ncbi:hemerythrin domain-containing protein [Thauera sp. Sel9]|uniref:hemerythrin domain-containing protein n=1 Tax=Thauera sp. Sel9 TaxID=2974299 RepID=UPI0021E1A0A4|nr:hemerythrin domain-containing protein [Thauera sp. Sel9]MCV2219741.1 hemerythrin domain-containing protein [Thauera sp. Sel9]
MSYESLDIIHDEHRALAAMLSGLGTLVAGIEAGRLQPDFNLMASMIDYIDKVPEKVHHPKEDAFLFAKLRLRSKEALPIIEHLEEEHRQGDERIAALRTALETYRQNGVAGLAGFQAALKTYTAHEWQHMNMEERMIFPLAKAHLSAEDWAEIDAAFLANDNPWQGAAGEYAALFSRIVNIAPAPVGLGG